MSDVTGRSRDTVGLDCSLCPEGTPSGKLVLHEVAVQNLTRRQKAMAWLLAARENSEEADAIFLRLQRLGSSRNVPEDQCNMQAIQARTLCAA